MEQKEETVSSVNDAVEVLKVNTTLWEHSDEIKMFLFLKRNLVNMIFSVIPMTV